MEPSGSVRKHRRARVNFHGPGGPLAAAEGEAHENGITESKALRNLRQTFNLSNTTLTGARSALFTRAAGGRLL